VLSKDEGKGTSWQERRNQWLYDEGTSWQDRRQQWLHDVNNFQMNLRGPRHFPQTPSGAAHTFKAGAATNEVNLPDHGDSPKHLQFEMGDSA